MSGKTDSATRTPNQNLASLDTAGIFGALRAADRAVDVTFCVVWRTFCRATRPARSTSSLRRAVRSRSRARGENLSAVARAPSRRDGCDAGRAHGLVSSRRARVDLAALQFLELVIPIDGPGLDLRQVVAEAQRRRRVARDRGLEGRRRGREGQQD